MSWLKSYEGGDEEEAAPVTVPWTPSSPPVPVQAPAQAPAPLAKPARNLFASRGPVPVAPRPQGPAQAPASIPGDVLADVSQPSLPDPSLLTPGQAASLPALQEAVDAARQVAAEPAEQVREGHLSLAQVRDCVPAHLKPTVTKDLVALLNNLTQDEEAASHIREHFVSWRGVLQDGQFTTEQYLNAVAYVSFKMGGYSNQDAYARALPDRWARIRAEGRDPSSAVSMFHKGKLVTKLLRQVLVPAWLLNQDAFQQAVNVQVSIMNDEGNSAKVRSDAADSLMNHLKEPEKQAGALQVEIKEGSGLKELLDQNRRNAELMQEMIRQGKAKTVDVAATRIFDREAEDV